MSGGEAESVQWAAPIIVLAAGIIVGLFFLLRVRRSTAVTSHETPTPTRSDLQIEFDAMIERLRELAGGGDAFDEERLALEREAAVVLRDLTAAPVHVAADATPVTPKNRAAQAMVWITGISVVLAITYIVLLQASAPRTGNGPLTGGMPTGDTALAALEQQVAAEPQNLDRRVDLAQAFLERGDMQGVFRETQQVLQRHPEHARALSYHALALLSVGDVANAQRLLEQALRKQPDLVEAWIHLSLVHTQRGDRDAAIAALRNAKQRAPESASMFDTLEREIEARFNATAPAAAASGAEGYQLRINGPAGAKGVIFVALRPAGATAGPPIAAKRVDVGAFPIDVTLSASDSMQGGSLPPIARIDVRVDADGNVMTREPSDPKAVADDVKLGSTTELTLE